MGVALTGVMSFLGSAKADVRPELRAQVADEGHRLVQHFQEVLIELAARDTSHLTQTQKRQRGQAIALLSRYRDRGVFPKNRDFNNNTPYFIDGSGTRCAMAYLIEESGERSLVARVANTANNAYVQELAGDPQLLKWLELHGLSLQEAARIQPTYEAPSCAENCRDDELCIQETSGNECSRFCNLNTDDCGSTSTCEVHPSGDLSGAYACSPAVKADGPRPEPDSCAVVGNGSSTIIGLVLVALFVAGGRRRRSRCRRLVARTMQGN